MTNWSSRPPRGLRDGPLPLEDLEPFVVAVTLLSAVGALVGTWGGATPSLVLLCWFLFLVLDPPPAGVRSSGALLGETTLRWAPAIALAGLGWGADLLPMLPLSPGLREFLLGTTAGGLAYLGLPRSRERWLALVARRGRGRVA